MNGTGADRQRDRGRRGAGRGRRTAGVRGEAKWFHEDRGAAGSYDSDEGRRKGGALLPSKEGEQGSERRGVVNGGGDRGGQDDHGELVERRVRL